MKVTIKVGPTEIANGKPNHHCDCPIALAFKDLTRAEVTVYVYGTSFTLCKQYKSKEWCGFTTETHHGQLPKKACTFVKRTDNRSKVETFNFDIEIPEAEYKKFFRS